MKFLSLLILLIGCGKVQEKKSSFPENNASAVESETFHQALTTIQAEFDKLNIQVDLDSLPYNINDLGTAMGVCYKKASGGSIGIALDHGLFVEFIEDDDEYGVLYKVLLHEIGHCFFNRIHDEESFKVTGFDMLIKYYPEEPAYPDQSFTQSLMSEMGFYRVPKTIWPYYVKEIAGMERIKTWEDIANYVEVRLIREHSIEDPLLDSKTAQE